MTDFNEKRSDPRFELLAQVQIGRESDVYIMSTLNLSRGGVFIQADPAECPELTVGVEVDLVIFASDDFDVGEVTITGTIVRVQPAGSAGALPGFGVQFEEVEPGAMMDIDRLLQLLSAQAG